MRRIIGQRLHVAAAVVILMAAAHGCGGGKIQPCPEASGDDSLCPTQGTAHVVVTGAEDRTFDAPLDPQGNPRPGFLQSKGVIQLNFRDRSKLPTDSFRFSGARAKADAQQVGAVILIHGAGFETDDGCTITLTSFDAQQIAGSFTCRGLHPILLENSTYLIDASGTFSASG